MLRMLDLFSGIGGFSLAGRWAGIETIQFVEIDPFCQKVLAKNFPGIPIHDDIKTFNKGDEIGTVEIITAGVPCQPASKAGKRLGRADDRWIWDEVVRVFAEIHPTWAIFENVDGLLTLESGMVFELLLSQMENEGYETQSYIIPACSVGAPHQRNRLWIIANANGSGCDHGEEKKGLFVYNQKSNNQIKKQGRQFKQCRVGESDCNVTNTESQYDRRYKREKEKRRIQESGNGVESETIANATKSGLSKSRPSRIEELQKEKGKRVDDRFKQSNCDVSNSDSERLAKRESQRDDNGKEFTSTIGGDWGESWYEVATQFCRVDDGLSSRVDRRKRAKRLEALGNSIVPQVAYQILKSIVEIEKQLMAEVA